MSRTERIDRLRQTLEDLPRAIDHAERAGGAQAEGWSLLEVLTHLADAETVYGIRARLLVSESDPVLQPYDQEAWAARYAALETIGTALERWRVMREANLRLFDSLAEDDWSKTGLHLERGRESLEHQLVRMSDHDVAHLGQIEAL